MTTQIFDFTKYRDYLESVFVEMAKTKRGVRSRFAEFLDVEPGYISQVLSGKSDLSTEQAAKAAKFFTQTDDEAQYFVLLVSLERAGNPQLRRIYQKQIDAQREQFLNMKKRFKVEDTLSEIDQHVYYGSWQYAAIHTAVSIHKLRTKEALASHFKLEINRVSQVLDFLARSGLIRSSLGEYLPANRWVHLGKDSTLASKNHVNWRLEAIRSLENQVDTDLHYSSVIGISAKDKFAIKAIMVKTLEEIRGVIKDSTDETVCSILIDFFEL